MQKIHLICNAHLDPVWQWGWEEGAAAALSTFRTAAEICEENDVFIFNHNEAILYKWVEEYEPDLFVRIQKLVQKGKWHIMGGWYLQPDCNMLSGESFVRQILMGRTYFIKQFNQVPKTAVNFDSFGHSRGLVQILTKSGFDSYVFMRPDERELKLPSEDFIWVGFDHSKIIVHRIEPGYNSALGQAVHKIEKWKQKFNKKETGFLAWGIGNHGGGPSRQDVKEIADLMKNSDAELVHSIPEDYFKEIEQEKSSLQEVNVSFNPNQVGCYTTQSDIKHGYRLLENTVFAVEKMITHASAAGLIEYPEEMDEILEDLAFVQFHDILAGTSVHSAEREALWQIGHGLHLCSKVRTKAFFAFLKNEKKAEMGVTPIFAYNPHPYQVSSILICELCLENQNWSEQIANPILLQNGQEVICQLEKQESNINFLDWRKRIVFKATLEPMSMNRFNCSFEYRNRAEKRKYEENKAYFVFKNKQLEVHINKSTGCMDKYCVNGKDFLKNNAFLPEVMEDSDDSWGMAVRSFPDKIGEFTQMTPEQCGKLFGTDGQVNPVRVIEDGPVRIVIESMFSYKENYICTQYIIPKTGTEIEIVLQVFFTEPSKMLKLLIPTTISEGDYMGQTAFGIHHLDKSGIEVCANRWSAAADDLHMLTCINDGTYGSDYRNGNIRISLLRTCGYAAHPAIIENRFDMSVPILLTDRYTRRVDLNLQEYHFWLNAGEKKKRSEAIEREAEIHNETPYLLAAFPSGVEKASQPFLYLDDPVIVMTACKRSEDRKNIIVRLFEPTGQERETRLNLPDFEISYHLNFSEYEVKTLEINPRNKEVKEVSLMEVDYGKL